MGILLWLASGVVAGLIARIVPPGRRSGASVEIVIAIVAAAILGLIATQLDFGGWRELDWRAAAFACLGAFATLGAIRATMLAVHK